MTRCEPRTVCMRFEQFFFGDGVELQKVFGFGIGFGEGEEQMLGRDEVVFHRARLRAATASSTWLRAELRPGWPTAPLCLGKWSSSPSTMRSRLPRLTPIFSSSGRTMPSSSASSAASRCNGIDLRIAVFGGQFLRALHGFLSFEGEFVEAKCHG